MKLNSPYLLYTITHRGRIAIEDMNYYINIKLIKLAAAKKTDASNQSS